MSNLTWLIFLISVIYSSLIYSKSWNYQENPILRVSNTLNINLDSLPQSGEITKFMGSNWIWPYKEGFIANRWALQNPKKASEKFKYKLLKLKGLVNIDTTQLSPAEKFDIYTENTNWEFTRSLRGHYKKLKNPGLYLELSFAQTSLNYPGQDPLSIKTDSSILNFGASDLKALLTVNYFLNYASKAQFLGNRCLNSFSELKTLEEAQVERVINSPNCLGLNPGAFHIMISNYLGIKDQGLALDLERDKRLKIRPIIGYISKLQKVKNNLVEVTTYLKYLSPTRPTWISDMPGPRGITILKYNLELDKLGNISGGRWLSANRPDFIVIPQKLRLIGNLSKLKIHIKNVENYKTKSLMQKLIIKDLLNRISKKEKIPSDTLNALLLEYANTFQDYYKQKKNLKRKLRKINTREVDTERDILLKRLSKHNILGNLRKTHQYIIDIALMNKGNIFKKFLMIRSKHNKFINQARRNSEGNDLKTLGKVAYIQKKLINNYFKKSINKKVDINSLYLNFLMESNIYKRSGIQTSSKDFLTKSTGFLEGLRSESDFFKLNRKGRIFPIKGELLDKKIKDLEGGEPSLFKRLSKKLILKRKVSKNNAWKGFLKVKPSRTIASIARRGPKEELNIYLNLSTNQKKLKNEYTTKLLKISINFKKGKKDKKVPTKSQINKKLKAIILSEIEITKKNYNFDLYLLRSYKEILSQTKNRLFQDPKIELIKNSLFNEYQQTLTRVPNINQKFIEIIKLGNIKEFKTLQKHGPSLSYEGIEGENAIMTAAKFGQTSMLKDLLMNSEIPINQKNSYGQNALFLAIINENKIGQADRFEIIKSLLNAGIKKKIKDKFGKIPNDYISDSGPMENMLEALLK